MTFGTFLKYFGPPIVVIGLLIFLYTAGYNNGVGAIQAERKADQAAQALLVAELRGQLKAKEDQHARETAKLSSQLASQSATYADELRRIELSYAGGLRDSEQRAFRYRAIAEAGTDQCRNLASHTAELDRSIVEGRQVVEELRATIVLRDTQLKLVGAQLISDRQLYENYGTDHN